MRLILRAWGRVLDVEYGKSSEPDEPELHVLDSDTELADQGEHPTRMGF